MVKSRIKCNLCDARAWSEEALRNKHSPGCPYNKNAQTCKDCGRAGTHAPRCPQVKGNPR